MFEVGKKYRASSGTIYECLTLYNDQAWLVDPHGRCSTWTKHHIVLFTEYKEPQKYVRYYNIYPNGNYGGVAGPHSSRSRADKNAAPGRIGCKRVVFTDGEFDE